MTKKPLDVIMQAYRGRENLPIEEGASCTPQSLLDKLKEKVIPKRFNLHSLEKFTRTCPSAGVNLSYLLAFMEPENVLREFGEGTLIWTRLTYNVIGRSQFLLDELQRLTGKSADHLEKARLSQWKLNNFDDNPHTVMATFKIIEGMGDFTKQLPLAEYLRKTSQVSILSEERIQDYGLLPLHTKDRHEKGYDQKGCWFEHGLGLIPWVYLDSPVGIALTHKDWPQATISFLPRTSRTLMIHQIQGYSPKIVDEHEKEIGRIHARGLAPLDWKALMMEIGYSAADYFGFTRLGFIGAKNSPWINFQGLDKEPHLTMEQAVQKYDAVALRFGFRQDKDGDFYKSL